MAELWTGVRSAPTDKRESLPKPREAIVLKSSGAEDKAPALPSSSSSTSGQRQLHPAKKIRTEEKGFKPKRVNGEGGGGGSNRPAPGYGTSGGWPFPAVPGGSLCLAPPGSSRSPHPAPRPAARHLSNDKPKKSADKREKKKRREEEENGELKAATPGIPRLTPTVRGEYDLLLSTCKQSSTFILPPSILHDPCTFFWLPLPLWVCSTWAVFGDGEVHFCQGLWP